MESLDSERLELLNEALQALLPALQPSAESDLARRRVVADMQSLVTTVLPQELHFGVETFGSFRAGLHLPGSDLDFALSGWVDVPPTPPSSSDDEYGDGGRGRWQMEEPDGGNTEAGGSAAHGGGTCSSSSSSPYQQRQQQQQQQRRLELHEWDPLEQQYLLSDLADALEREGLVQGQVERVLHARVPVIKFTHAATGLSCDFSINRPECVFKAEMQKLLGSLDRRYAALYRLVKVWAAAHGLNDASSNTLNSWSLGLMLVFYLQCEQPAILPPIWQLLERQPPARAAPRLLQQPQISCAALKRLLNVAATGAGAYTLKRRRLGPDAENHKTLAELLLGFWTFFGAQMDDWLAATTTTSSSSSSRNKSNRSSRGGRNGSGGGCSSRVRASCWWGSWTEAGWPPGKQYIFGIEDPFHAEDNTARSVGTHNHMSSAHTASYIAYAFNASAGITRRALCGSSSSGSSDSSSSSSRDPAQAILSAYCWLFGPSTLLDNAAQLPAPLSSQLSMLCPPSFLADVTSALAELGEDCSSILAGSSAAANTNPHRHRQQQQQQDAAVVEARKQRVAAAVTLFRRLLTALGCPELHLCLADHLKVLKKQQQEEDERRRQEWQQQERQRHERQQQRQQQQQERQQQRRQQQQQEWQDHADRQQQQDKQQEPLQMLHIQSVSAGVAVVQRGQQQSSMQTASSGVAVLETWHQQQQQQVAGNRIEADSRPGLDNANAQSSSSRRRQHAADPAAPAAGGARALAAAAAAAAASTAVGAAAAMSVAAAPNVKQHVHGARQRQRQLHQQHPGFEYMASSSSDASSLSSSTDSHRGPHRQQQQQQQRQSGQQRQGTAAGREAGPSVRVHSFAVPAAAAAAGIAGSSGGSSSSSKVAQVARARGVTGGAAATIGSPAAAGDGHHHHHHHREQHQQQQHPEQRLDPSSSSRRTSSAAAKRGGRAAAAAAGSRGESAADVHHGVAGRFTSERFATAAPVTGTAAAAAGAVAAAAGHSSTGGRTGRKGHKGEGGRGGGGQQRQQQQQFQSIAAAAAGEWEALCRRTSGGA